MSAVTQASRGGARSGELQLRQFVDPWLAFATASLLSLGLVMVASASIAIADRAGNALFYFERQAMFAVAGVLVMVLIAMIPLSVWERLATPVLIAAVLALALVLVPGIGREVNGARRWLPLGVFNLQVSEVAKLAMILFLSGYLVRRGGELRERFQGFLKPVLVALAISVLLLAEPDFGAVVVLMSVVLGLLFLAGARLWEFVLLVTAGLGAGVVLAVTSPYRMQRITAFLDPWADPFDSGFQLTQSLIAIGSGGWFGEGLGGSIQKLFYLPEAHTDFLFAVLAEELGLTGALLVIALFMVFVWRCFAIGRAAEQAGRPFAAWIACGVGIWFSLQAFINIGVNMGLLPTKGLTLPLMSAGGSSMLVMCAAVGLVIRAHREALDAVATSAAGHRTRGVMS